MIIRVFPQILALVLLTSCTATPAVPGATEQKSAHQIVTELAQRVPTAKPGVVFTAGNDPNKLLGRPGGYTSKASFTDSRVPPEDVIGASDGAVEYGGSVEVFETEDAARRRKEFIDRVGAPLAVEYSWVSGPVLLRVSRILTPDQAGEYEEALTEIS